MIAHFLQKARRDRALLNLSYTSLYPTPTKKYYTKTQIYYCHSKRLKKYHH
jgi:hypothetical protein